MGLLTIVAMLTIGGINAAAAPGAGLAGEPVVKDPSGIDCPPGPSGWALSTVNGKMVWDGQHDARLAGLHQVAVNCNYVTSDDKHIEVTVAYALPTDPNPINDFSFGCSSGGVKWTSKERMFHVSSQKQWALATFNDLLLQISENEARAFETVTRQLLQNAEGYGHDCQLKVAPTALKTEFTFRFLVNGAGAHGSFYAQGAVSGKTNSAPVVETTVPNFALNVSGTKKGLVLKVTRGIAYYPQSPGSGRKVRLAVVVVSSKLPSCRKGASGTLTVTATPSVQLNICGKAFLRGRAVAQILQR